MGDRRKADAAANRLAEIKIKSILILFNRKLAFEKAYFHFNQYRSRGSQAIPLWIT